jgi:hypothetical protein
MSASNPTPRSPAAPRQAHDPLVRGSRRALRIAYGPLLWALHLTALYGFTALACARGFAHAVPWVIAVATLVLGAAAALLMLRFSKPQFMDWLTAALAALSLVAIVWQALPVLLVSPCG